MVNDGQWTSGESLPSDSSADTAASAPIDIAAVRHDDALIDAIASESEFEFADADEALVAELFVDWRAAIVAPALPAGPDLDAVEAAVHDAIRARRYRMASMQGLRLLRPVMSAAAVLAIVVGGLSVFSYNAAPGDPLWGVKEVVFKEQAESTVAQLDTNNELQQVDDAITSGDPEQAIDHLSSAAQAAQKVNDDDARDRIMTTLSSYLTLVKSTFPNVPTSALSSLITPSSTPEPPSSEAGVPAGSNEGGSSSSSTTTTQPTPTTTTTESLPSTAETTTTTASSVSNAAPPVGQSEPGSETSSSESSHS
ncbi:anti-sigma-D factor RsdA [Smaragdicoccus niigatensis]|uniref:anti-sigma-D factor RsdA n=1 Tax=Smaragdicoccus niigatensis TaxID=359359 RepID=UPI00036F8C7B|nr:anti-sigma-D factor RsdA [Smaragdicoccus niigatensis]